MPLLKMKHPTLVVSGFEGTLELSWAFKNAGIQLKTGLMCCLCQISVRRGREELGGGYFLEISLDTEVSHTSFLHQELDHKIFCSLAATPFLPKEGNGDGDAFS